MIYTYHIFVRNLRLSTIVDRKLQLQPGRKDSVQKLENPSNRLKLRIIIHFLPPPPPPKFVFSFLNDLQSMEPVKKMGRGVNFFVVFKKLIDIYMYIYTFATYLQFVFVIYMSVTSASQQLYKEEEGIFYTSSPYFFSPFLYCPYIMYILCIY